MTCSEHPAGYRGVHASGSGRTRPGHRQPYRYPTSRSASLNRFGSTASHSIVAEPRICDRAQPVADRLPPTGVVDRGECVVRRGEADPGLRGLPLRPVVTVDAELRVIREGSSDRSVGALWGR